MGLEGLKSLLDQHYQFPCCYTFKFVLDAQRRAEVVGLLGEASIVKERLGQTGKYLGLTFSRTVESSDEVVDIYQKAALIDGIIAL